jgi:hypothetical protein
MGRVIASKGNNNNKTTTKTTKKRLGKAKGRLSKKMF